MTKCLVSNERKTIEAIADDLQFIDGMASWNEGKFMDFANTEENSSIIEIEEPILGYVYDNGVVSPPVPVTIKEPVPFSVTRRQAVQQLIIEGLDDDVEAVVASIPDTMTRKLMTVWYKDSQVFERNRPEILQVWAALGRTEEQLDDTFRAAAKL